MATTTFVLTHGIAGDYQGTASMRPKEAAKRAIRLLEGVQLGSYAATVLQTKVTQAFASGTVTIASGSGSITATINGVATAVTWGTSDTATATALAAAINASSDALVNKHVSATSALGVVTITAINGGYVGNAVTLAASGTGATASVARLAGGSATITNYTF